MIHLATILLSAFGVSFVTVLLPNPSTLAAGNLAMQEGLQSARKFLTAVLVLDALVFLVLAFGFHPLMRAAGIAEYLLPVAGVAIIIFGIVMLAISRGRLLRGDNKSPSETATGHGPFLAGLLVPAANPGYWLWWTTVGASFIHGAKLYGDSALALLMIAMLGGAGFWYFILLRALSHGRKVFSPRLQAKILSVLGIIMILLGLYLSLQSLKILP